jgi:glycosyltransferase involved in cell wall biosynthesis
MQAKISVIISTFNAEEWLEKVLWGFNCQSFKNFEVVIADDGSGPATKAMIDKLTNEVFYSIKHIWQEDQGFQKSKILNKALKACEADYIVMTDGDCIPRQDFVEVHFHNREKGFFLSGGYCKLPLSISKLIAKEDIAQQSCFSVDWINSHDLPKKFKNKKLGANTDQAKFLNKFTPTKASWNGHNASGWKEDILAVNGFDERMQYGGQDRELGERLFNYGVRAKQLRYSAICVHLDHERSYRTKESISRNKAIRKEVKVLKIKWTFYGISKRPYNNYVEPKRLSSL